jgi:hypothetical protein
MNFETILSFKIHLIFIEKILMFHVKHDESIALNILVKHLYPPEIRH